MAAACLPPLAATALPTSTRGGGVRRPRGARLAARWGCSEVLGHCVSDGRSWGCADLAAIQAVRMTRAAKGSLDCHATAGDRSPAPSGKSVIAVVGGTGFIGRKLVERLLADGQNVRVLTRSIAKAKAALPASNFHGVEFFEPRDWQRAIEGCSGVVNLAGKAISTRWTPEVKAELKSSRVEATNKIVNAINNLEREVRPKVLVSSSALGYYGTSKTDIFDETSPSGNDYLAEVCVAWEAASSQLDQAVTRLVQLRTGIVLDKDGGALAKMIPIFKIFAGGPLGSGKQWFSWVHRDDLVSLIMEALRNPSYTGVINGTAPHPVRLAEMCDQLGRMMGRPSWLPVPEFVIKMMLGDGAVVVLEGQKVLPKRAQDLGFAFRYPYVGDAISSILAN